MLAAKHLDIVMGIDIHIVMLPTPAGPVPTPLPHPFVGIMFDPKDYDVMAMALAAASAVGLGAVAELGAVVGGALAEAYSKLPSERVQELIFQARNAGKEALGITPPHIGPATVQINGLPRVKCGSIGNAMPPHFPLGGPFQKGKVDNACEMFLGSLSVHADKSPLSFAGCMVFSCSCVGMPSPVNHGAELFLPTSVVNCIPMGLPVMVGGAPVPDFNAMAGKLFNKAFNSALNALRNSRLMKAISRKLHQAASKLMDKLGIPANSFLRNLVHNEICRTTGHPVVIATGKVFTDRTDFELPGPVPLVFERTWQSTSVYQGPLGHGWHWNYDLALAYDDDAVVLRMADGRPAVFPRLEVGESFTNPSENLTLLPHDGGFTIRNDKENLFYEFVIPAGEVDRPLPLAAVRDGAGRAIRFDYDARHHLRQITDSAGRILPVSCDRKGRITSVRAPHPKNEGEEVVLVSFAYDEATGDLLESRDALGHPFRYAYEDHLLVRETNRNGLSFYFAYDERKYCVHTWGDGGIYDHKLVYNPEEKWTTVEDSLGNVSKYFWNDRGLVWKTVDPLGHERLERFNEQNKLVAEIDELGRYTAYEYDASGNRTRIVYPDGSEVSLGYEAGLLVAATDQIRGSWGWAYNEARQLTGRTDSMGRKTEYRYDKAGDLVELVDPAGNVTGLAYDERHQLVALTTADGARSRWRYDRLGRVTSSTDPRGNLRERKLNLLGNTVKVREPDGNVRVLQYDAEENITHAQDKQYDVAFAYVGMNRLAARTEAGTQVQFDYNTEEDLVGIRNEHGYAYRFGLDACGQVVRESGFDGLTREYVRDPAGQVARVLRPDDRSTDYGYDALGRVTSVAHWDGTAEAYAYRADGELLSATNGAIRVGFERDKLGRVVRESQGGFVVRSEYDILGNRTGLRSSLGAEVTISRNRLGDVEEVISGGRDDDPWSVRFERDLLGLELERSLPGGVRSRWQRDRLGRPTKQVTTVGGERERSRTYHWGINDRLKSIVDSAKGKFEFEHDVFGNLSAATYPDGTRELRMPDAVGNLFRTANRGDRKYGPAGQLLEADGTQFRYDPEGNLIEKIRPDGDRWTYAWNAAGMLARLRRPDGRVVTFTYDPLGRRIAKQYGRHTTRWVWDGNVMLHEWREEAPPTPPRPGGTPPPDPQRAGGFSIRRRDEQLVTAPATAPPGTGQPTNGTALASPEPTEPITTVEGELTTWLFEPESFAPLAKLTPAGDFSIVTDHLGTPLSMFRDTGAKSWELELSIYGDTRNLDGWRGECPFRYPGQYEDAETGLYYNRFRYFDPEVGGYVSQDPIGLRGGIGHYLYCENVVIEYDPFGLSTETVFIDPYEIRFSQSSVRKDKLLGYAQSMSKDGWVGDAIDVVRMADGKLTTVDNTRLLAASLAGIHVKANIHDCTAELPEDQVERFTKKNVVPQTWGDAAQLRVQNQNKSWKNSPHVDENGGWFTEW
ncbi:DUF6531 domain-containing protein [Lewinella sp. IMCC34183]|uniref:DUF6531 domain-containing protein n=1 Tax=Lewinella sp. IMCC34183 TaxID=2248762 RepID=UPI000E23795F|nr:DUF6531 domain-containing protein [Lewinella sp. IMCC34183]